MVVLSTALALTLPRPDRPQEGSLGGALVESDRKATPVLGGEDGAPDRTAPPSGSACCPSNSPRFRPRAVGQSLSGRNEGEHGQGREPHCGQGDRLEPAFGPPPPDRSDRPQAEECRDEDDSGRGDGQ